MIASAFTSPMFSWIASPLHTEMEVSLCDYLCEQLSLPTAYTYREGGAGVIVGTRNEAIIPVLYTAKHRKQKEIYNDMIHAQTLDAGPPDISGYEGRYVVYTYRETIDGKKGNLDYRMLERLCMF